MIAPWNSTVRGKLVGSAIVAASSLLASEAMAQQTPPGSELEAPPSAPSPVASSASAPGVRHGLLGDSTYRSPGLAVALSLTPMPVDFGNLYAENFGWGVAYTAVELSLMVPMMWLVGGHMDHGRDNTRSWSNGERNTMIGVVSSYAVVKVVAGLHAGYSAREFNRSHEPAVMAFVAPTAGGALLTLGGSF